MLQISWLYVDSDDLFRTSVSTGRRLAKTRVFILEPLCTICILWPYILEKNIFVFFSHTMLRWKENKNSFKQAYIFPQTYTVATKTNPQQVTYSKSLQLFFILITSRVSIEVIIASIDDQILSFESQVRCILKTPYLLCNSYHTYDTYKIYIIWVLISW